MRLIIPLFFLLATFMYLFYSPSPMDKIGETVKTRNCYKLKLMDQERISLSTEKTISNDHPTASIQHDIPAQNRKLIKDSEKENLSLALSAK